MFYGSEAPANFNSTAVAAGCFLEHTGRFLMLRRIEGKPFASLWQLPGGKVDPNERPHQAMHRDLWEETGLALPVAPADAAKVVYVSLEQTGPFAYHLFRMPLEYTPTITLNPKEHSAMRWFTPEEALASSEIFPHTDDCIRLVYGL